MTVSDWGDLLGRAATEWQETLGTLASRVSGEDRLRDLQERTLTQGSDTREVALSAKDKDKHGTS